jgi:hypothetical protein
MTHRHQGLTCAVCNRPIFPDELNKVAIDFIYCPHCSRELLEKDLPFKTQSDHRCRPTDDVFYGKVFIGTMWKRGSKNHAHPIAGPDKEFTNELDAKNFLYITSLQTWFVTDKILSDA